MNTHGVLVLIVLTKDNKLCLFIYMSVYSVCLSNCLSVYLCVPVYLYFYLFLSTFISFCLYFSLSFSYGERLGTKELGAVVRGAIRCLLTISAAHRGLLCLHAL